MIEVLKLCPYVNELSISGCRALGDATLTQLHQRVRKLVPRASAEQQLEAMPDGQLRALDLSNSGAFTARAVAAVVSRVGSRLEALNITAAPQCADDALLAAVAVSCAASLRRLAVAGRIAPSSSSPSSALSSPSSSARLVDAAAAATSSGSDERLVSSLTGEGLAVLARCTRLQSLDLSDLGASITARLVMHAGVICVVCSNTRYYNVDHCDRCSYRCRISSD
jgi:hypothetical protein